MQPRDNFSSLSCPNWDELLAYQTGNLPPHAAEAIAAHLSVCARCLNTLVQTTDKERRPSGATRQSMQPTRATAPLDSNSPGTMLQATVAERPRAQKFVPFTLGQYELVRQIGCGGMGSVYQGVHGRLKMSVAVKVLPSERTRDPRAVARFQREMEAIGRVRHPNIVRATDAGEAGGVHFLVMELVDGVDLSRLVRLCGPLRVPDACELLRQAASGLGCAHEYGLVHRDVKPSNMMLSRQGQLQILDLGLALLNQGESQADQLTMTGQVMGTADYMAPEQWAACHAVDIRADVYSLGCVLHTLLTGRAPFAGPEYGSAQRKMAAHAGETPSPLTASREDIPVELQALFERLVAKEPDNRPQTPAEVADALRPFCGGADLPALACAALEKQVAAVEEGFLPGGPGLSPPTPRVERSSLPGSKRRWRRGFVAAAVVLGLLAVALGIWSWSTRPGGQPSDAVMTPEPVQRPQPGGWRSVLAEKPRTRLWVTKVDARLDHDPGKEMLWVQSSHPALIRLGETQSRAYKLQIGLRQVVWVGGVGVYIAGKGQEFRFQLIDLRSFEVNVRRAFTLNRSTGSLWSKPGFAPDVPLRSFASSILPHPPGNQEQMLELEVGLQGLVYVRWNGVPCQELSGKANQAAQWPDYRGEFGVYCMGSNVIVSTARFLPIE